MALEWNIRRATTADVPQLLDLHYRVFDPTTHRLLLLGRDFIARAYRWYCESADAFCLVADGPLGLGGCIAANQGSSVRVCRSNWWAVLRGVARRPGLLPRLFTRLQSRFGALNRPSPRLPSGPCPAFVAWLAVDPAVRRNGLGRTLLAACVQECQLRNWSPILGGVRPANLPSRRLCQRVGFAETAGPDPDALITIALDSDPPPDLPPRPVNSPVNYHGTRCE